MTISFDSTADEFKAAVKVARRFRQLQRDTGMRAVGQRDTVMDLLATNANGCRLDFDKMLAASDFDLAHDVSGIARHLDRDDNSATGGKLLNHFWPRCAKKQEDA